MSFDILQDKIRAMKNPTVAGLDARAQYVPPHILSKHVGRYGETLQAAAEAIFEFNCGLMDCLCDIVPAVKPQSAYYELLGWRGMEMLERTIAYAKGKGFFVIADIKRGDIGATAQAYAEAWLGKSRVGSAALPVFDADCVTVNGYMGSDSILPFLDACKANGKCLFVLVKTSNPARASCRTWWRATGWCTRLWVILPSAWERYHRQAWLYPHRRGCGGHLPIRPARAAPPSGADLLSGARLRRAGRYRRGRAACL
jgi:orotidine 5'-phosphate decarboxylase subfamily 2